MKKVVCTICETIFFTKTTGKFCSIKCRKINKSRINKDFYSKNKNKINQVRKKHYLENTDYYKKRDKEKWLNEKLKDPTKKTRTDLSHLTEVEKEKRRKNERKKYRNQKYKTDVLYNLKTRYRSLLNKKLRELKLGKSSRTLDFLGCDWKVFKVHIEKQFKHNMNWNNRELWDIDHIIPISEGRNIEEIKKLSHYTNLQPLWKEDNIKKSNKW